MSDFESETIGPIDYANRMNGHACAWAANLVTQARSSPLRRGSPNPAPLAALERVATAVVPVVALLGGNFLYAAAASPIALYSLDQLRRRSHRVDVAHAYLDRERRKREYIARAAWSGVGLVICLIMYVHTAARLAPPHHPRIGRVLRAAAAAVGDAQGAAKSLDHILHFNAHAFP